MKMKSINTGSDCTINHKYCHVMWSSFPSTKNMKNNLRKLFAKSVRMKLLSCIVQLNMFTFAKNVITVITKTKYQPNISVPCCLKNLFWILVCVKIIVKIKTSFFVEPAIKPFVCLVKFMEIIPKGLWRIIPCQKYLTTTWIR